MGGIVSSLVSTITLCVSYCACKSASSLCDVCFGSTDVTTTGRKRSILLLVATVALCLLFQFSWAPSMEGGNDITRIPYIGHRIKESFSDGCVDVFEDQRLVTKCIGYAGVYRATFTSGVFFLISSVATAFNPAVNRQAWPAKYTLCALFLMATFFMPNSPLFFGIGVWMARLGGSLFLVIQQVILIDLAYSWNEIWLQKSVEAESVEYGSGKKWLIAIVAAIIVLFVGCLTSIVLLFKEFSGCATNETLISVTLILIIALTAVQLTGEEGNLLTSAVMSSYAIYLVTSAVSHNPNSKCNPFLEKDGKLGIVVGIILTFVSLTWTMWSWTDERRFTSTGMKENPEGNKENSNAKPLDGLDIPFLDEQSNSVTGVVMEQSENADGWTDNELWKLNMVLALISSWITVTLTGWGSVTAQGGTIDVWFIIISQWVALGLYIWTLLAPRLYPDRDFA